MSTGIFHEKDAPLFHGLNQTAWQRRSAVYVKVMNRSHELSALSDLDSVKDILIILLPANSPKAIADKLGVSETLIRGWCSQLDVALPRSYHWFTRKPWWK